MEVRQKRDLTRMTTSRSILAVLQLYAALSSLSLSIFATCADSVFDPAANFVLLYCHKKAEKVDYRKYPSGGSKFETIGALRSPSSRWPLMADSNMTRTGDITYSGVMGAVSLILVVRRDGSELSEGVSDQIFHRHSRSSRSHARTRISNCTSPRSLLSALHSVSPSSELNQVLRGTVLTATTTFGLSQSRSLLSSCTVSRCEARTRRFASYGRTSACWWL